VFRFRLLTHGTALQRRNNDPIRKVVQVERLSRGTAQDRPKAKIWDLQLEDIFFCMHLLDRIAFSKLGCNGRPIFLDVVIEIMADELCGSVPPEQMPRGSARGLDHPSTCELWNTANF
jgi:hypothetical protein